MARHMPSWLRDTLRVWLQYWIIGLSSIPAGIAGFLLTQRGMTQRNAVIVSLLIAASLSLILWGVVRKKLFVSPQKVKHTTQENSAAADIQIQLQPFRLAGGISYVFVVALGASSPCPNVKVSISQPNEQTKTQTAPAYDYVYAYGNVVSEV